MDGGDQMYLTGDFIPEERSFKLPDFSNEYVLSNLEGPICSATIDKGIKVGVHLRSSPFELKGKWAFALANNHIMDYGYDGLKQTREFLESIGIRYCGAGSTQEESRKPIILEESGCKIAVFSCCEKQFGITGESTPGCAEMGTWLYTSVRDIKQAKKVDYVIVSCHAASEFSPWVSPTLRSFYHSLIDIGVDVIHGHHSHVPQGYEVYKDRPIFYGLGNFVVDVESPEALDLPYLRECFSKLEHGEIAKIPYFSFKEKKRTDDYTEIKMREGEVCLIEGLHALNPQIYGKEVERKRLLKVFLQPVPQDVEGLSEPRLLRRMIRDYYHRNAPATLTFSMWDGVRAGEEKYIKPFVDDADFVINTFFSYETGALKAEGVKILSEVKEDSIYYNRAKALLKELEKFPSYGTDVIPEDSLLNEFTQ
jgi:uridine kinase